MYYPIRYFVGLLLFLTCCVTSSANSAPKNSEYHAMTLEGWKVHVEQSLVKRNDRRVFKALRILSQKLIEVKKLLPPSKFHSLQTVPIWLSENSGRNAEFYFFEQRVFRNDKKPELLDGIEFQNIGLFLRHIRRSPLLLIHELAHAYHKMQYKKIDKQIMRAFKNAERKRLYKGIIVKGSKEKRDMYASKNAFEYFAELSEAYFGYNDYFPHTKRELKDHDPVGYKMVQSIWE